MYFFGGSFVSVQIFTTIPLCPGIGIAYGDFFFNIFAIIIVLHILQDDYSALLFH